VRITIGLPSRNRPAGLLSVLTALDKLATGLHDVTYGVLMDDDDYVTLEQFEHWKKAGMLPENVREFVGARDRTLNARMNDVYRAMPAELYSQVADDQFPLSLHWDAMFHNCRKLPVFAWVEATDPQNMTFPVVSHQWFQATGRYTVEHFPFWFADTWLAEVYALAFGMPVTAINQLLMGHGRRGATQGMRDLRFWFEFFAATRTERIDEAQRVVDAFGLKVSVLDRTQELAAMREGDAEQLRNVPRYEQNFSANLGEPSPMYRKAKADAENWLASNRVAEAA
jgi:hypothetical protein